MYLFVDETNFQRCNCPHTRGLCRIRGGWSSLPAELPQSLQLAASGAFLSQTVCAAEPGFVSAYPSRLPLCPVSERFVVSVVKVSTLLIPLTLVQLIPQN